MHRLICVFVSLLLVSLLVLSSCDERSYTIDEVVTAVMERGYDWETVSTGEGSIWGYDHFISAISEFHLPRQTRRI